MLDPGVVDEKVDRGNGKLYNIPFFRERKMGDAVY